MPRALLDAERVVAADGHSREAGRAQVVEGDALLAVVVGEEVGALHAGAGEVLAEEERP